MHKSKVLVSITVLSLLISIMLICIYAEHSIASGIDIYVDDDQRYPDDADGSLYNPFKNIQDAIEIAQDGDTIKILSGKYTGDIVVDKSIIITTESVEDVMINSSQKNAYLIDVIADSVSLEGLSIIDTTTTSHRKAVIHISSEASGVKVINSLIDFSRNGYGIFIEDSLGAVIRNSTINNTRGIYIGNSNLITLDYNRIWNCSEDPAIRIVNSIGNHIVNNYIDNSNYGIYASECSNTLIENNTIAFNKNSGTLIVTGSGNEILNNTIDGNHLNGIDLSGDDCIVKGNNIKNNGMGISIGGSNCIIRDNYIYNSLHTGIYTRPGSKDNTIYNNTFKDNSDLNANEEGKNKWDNGYLGNWWDDFYGPNPANLNNTVEYDNINVPDIYKYRKNGVCDNYPKGTFQKQPTISNPSPANEKSGVDRSPILSVEVTDPEPILYKERLDVYFYYIFNNTYNLIGVNRNIESGGTASMPFSSTIKGKNAAYSYKGLGYDYIGVWYVEVEDSYSRVKSPIWIFTTINTPIDNKKPILDISVSNEYVVEDEVYAQIDDSIHFDASASYDPDGEIIFYKWTFPPDTSIINDISPTHSFKSEGTYKVNLVVIDNDGSSNSVNTTVIIEGRTNRPPKAVAVIDPKGYYEGYAGSIITFIGSDSSDPDGDSLTYEWDFGDGKNGTGEITTHTYTKAGKYTEVKLTVIDEHGETNTSNTYALVTNKTEDSPGYEIVLVFIGLLLVGILNKKRRNYFR